MNERTQQIAFRIFHYTLALVVFVQSIQTVIHATRSEHLLLHNTLLASFAGLEAIAALLFLISRTMKAVGYLLIGIFLFAFIFHVLHGEPNLALLVYAAGVALILAQSNAQRRG